MTTSNLGKLILTLVLSITLAACVELNQAGKTIGHTSRDVAKEIGHGSRDVAKGIGHGVKRVATTTFSPKPDRGKPDNEKKAEK